MKYAPARPPEGVAGRLAEARNLWVATVRPDGSPHLVPVWFAFHHGKFFFCIDPDSVKARNLRGNPIAALALEDGSSPVICRVIAKAHEGPLPEDVAAHFRHKYEWDLTQEEEYTLLIEAVPLRWLVW